MDHAKHYKKLEAIINRQEAAINRQLPQNQTISTFTNRLAAWLLYPETRSRMKADYGRHPLINPRWQFGAKQRRHEERLQQRALTKKMVRHIQNDPGYFDRFEIIEAEGLVPP